MRFLCGYRAPLGIAALIIPFLVVAHAANAEDDPLAQAHALQRLGRYVEAAELYDAVAMAHPLEAAIGKADCLLAQGEEEAALELLKTAAEGHPQSTAPRTRLAQTALDRGKWEESQAWTDQALALNDKDLAARWMTAELYLARGQLPEAEKAYEWFIDFYNDTDDISNPDDLYLIGQAAAQYARWTRNHDQFRFLINDLYPQAIAQDKNFWPARLAMGQLFLEKYNQASAVTELNAALTINPHAAEIHATRARLALQNYDLAAAQASIELALAQNRHCASAHRSQADVHMANFRIHDAILVLEKLRGRNPLDEETLGRLAAAYGVIDGLPENFDLAPSEDSRLAKLIAEVTERNAHCGLFFLTLADTLDLLRRYPAAAHYYREAAARMPQLVETHGKLGLVLMRLGEEVEAAAALEQSFKDDPFNVRVKNMLEVLDVLSGYAVLETDHFVIKFDRGHDEILAHAVAEYLEETVYPDVVAKMGYEPRGKTLFEIFNRARNTGGHGWFSTRMIGLPYIGTVGACAGRVVAMVSPEAMPQKFHWGRVLKHEFIHVVNLQQTNFNVPHWFTEALAVWNEEIPRPVEWTAILARRAKQDTLFDLDDINFGFVRPADNDDWTLAYCQAELYAEYMLRTYGDDALAKMLSAYADNLDTPEALRRNFDIQQEDFERGYRAFLDEVIQRAGEIDLTESLELADLQKAVSRDPKDAELTARLALAYLQRKSNATARKFALAAQKTDPDNQLAAYVLARLHIAGEDAEAAIRVLEPVVREQEPHRNTLALLAGLKLQQKDFTAAERLYRRGVAAYPDDPQWLKSLARVYLLSQNERLLFETLERLAVLEYDDLLIRKKLVQQALAKKDYATAVKWTNDALLIDVGDASLHAARAKGLEGQRKFEAAAQAYELAIRLQPDEPAWRLALAAVQVQRKQHAQARETLKKLRKIAPNYPGADVLLKSLE